MYDLMKKNSDNTQLSFLLYREEIISYRQKDFIVKYDLKKKDKIMKKKKRFRIIPEIRLSLYISFVKVESLKTAEWGSFKTKHRLNNNLQDIL